MLFILTRRCAAIAPLRHPIVSARSSAILVLAFFLFRTSSANGDSFISSPGISSRRYSRSGSSSPASATARHRSTASRFRDRRRGCTSVPRSHSRRPAAGRLGGGSYDPNDLGLFTVCTHSDLRVSDARRAALSDRLAAVVTAAAAARTATVLSGSRGGFPRASGRRLLLPLSR